MKRNEMKWSKQNRYKFPFSFPFPNLFDGQKRVRLAKALSRTMKMTTNKTTAVVIVQQQLYLTKSYHAKLSSSSSSVFLVLNNHTLSLFAICFIIHKYFRLMNSIAHMQASTWIYIYLRQCERKSWACQMRILNPTAAAAEQHHIVKVSLSLDAIKL